MSYLWLSGIALENDLIASQLYNDNVLTGTYKGLSRNKISDSRLVYSGKLAQIH